MNFLYCLLFFATPLIYSPFNSELFEVPKMYFVYAVTSAILALHLYGWIKGKHPLFRSTPLTLPLLLFLTSQAISTIFSIDTHTSLFGYYSRLNGGLISIICYLLLYFILSVHVSKELKSKIINYSLISGLIVSLYGIGQHFGIDKAYWVQDVQARVFSTLGQPNWLSAYLCLLLPFSLFKFLNSKTFFQFTVHSSLVTILYLCLLFTKSKTGILTALICLFLFSIFSLIQKQKNKFLLVTCHLLLITLTLSINNPIKDLIYPQKTSSLVTDHSSLNITPSQDIRKIVWQGALNLWRRYPFFGTGVETFAYSYYWVRPASHNLTSEWDFLYNKAHNEYLNFAATTGTFGLLTYLILIFSILFLFYKSQITVHSSHITISFLSILITNFTGFSIVITSLCFFLLPTLALNQNNRPSTIDHRRSFLFLVLIIPLFFTVQIFKLFLADIFFSQAQAFDSRNQLEPALSSIVSALNLSPAEPEHYILAGSITAKSALAVSAPKSRNYLYQQTLKLTETALNLSPANTNFWKQSAQNYYYLVTINPKLISSSINSLKQAVTLAPTDAKAFYLLAYFYQLNHDTDNATKYYQQAINLKPNYDHALFALAKIYFDQKKYPEAKDLFTKTLLHAPTNTDAQNYLNGLNKKSPSNI